MSRTQARLARRLDAFVEREGLGAVFTDVGIVLSRAHHTVRAPDVVFYGSARLPDSLPRGFLEAAPDLAVEVLSLSNTVSEARPVFQPVRGVRRCPAPPPPASLACTG